MAYKERYYTDFYGTSDKRTDNPPDEFILRILELDGTDPAEELEAAEFPVVINYNSSSDNKLQPLRGSWLDANLIATENFQLENLYTENERRWLLQVEKKGVQSISFSWYLNETPDGEFVDLNLQIEVNGVNVVDSFTNSEGTLNVSQGDTIRVYAYQLVAPLSGITGANLEITGVPVERSTTPLFDIDITFTATENTSVRAYTTYSDTTYTAIRSEIFYKASDGYPVVFTKSYISATSQADAQSQADGDAGFDAEGQAYADSFINYPSIWKGFIIPDGCQEQFYFPPYVVSINAVDGLGLLKNLSFVQNDGNFWIGKMTWIEVIYACLNRLGVPGMDIYTCVNIYEISMTQGDAYDPLALSFVQAERYIKDDGVTPMNCQEVLEAILQEWTASIIQSEGHWWVFRPTEVALNGTLVFRHYIDGIYQGILSKNIDVLLGGESEGVILAPLYHAMADQLKMIEKPYKNASMSYKYGERKNLDEQLDNPNLSGAGAGCGGDPVLPCDNVTIPGWTKTGTMYAGIWPTGGVIFYDQGGFPDISNYYENDNVFPIDLNHRLSLTIDYKNPDPIFNSDMVFQIIWNDGIIDWFLQADYSWSDTALDYFTVRSDIGDSGQLSITSAPVGTAGTITIRILAPTTTGRDIIYTRISASSFQDPGVQIGEIHTATQTEEFSFVPNTIEVFNGDSSIKQYMGAIYREDETTLTTKWVRRDLSESILCEPYETEKQFLRLAVEEIQRLYARPFAQYEGTVFNYFNPLSRFTINLFVGKFIPVGLSYDLQSNTCKAVLSRVSNEEIAMEYELEPDYGETTKVTIR